MLARSPVSTASAAGSAPRASSARAALRACSVTACPPWTNCRAANSPSPSDEPVTKTRAMRGPSPGSERNLRSLPVFRAVRARRGTDRDPTHIGPRAGVVLGPVDALTARAVVVVATLHVDVIADGDPRPGRRRIVGRRLGHRVQVRDDLDVVTVGHRHVEVAVVTAARVLLRQHLRHAAADVDQLIRGDRTGGELALIRDELLVVTC